MKIAMTISEFLQSLPKDEVVASQKEEYQPPIEIPEVQKYSFDFSGIARQKLTKKAVSDFLVWTSTKYNDWLGFGTKAENVSKVYESMKSGEGEDYIIECAQPSGENASSRYWKTKQYERKYYVSPKNKSIVNITDNKTIGFL